MIDLKTTERSNLPEDSNYSNRSPISASATLAMDNDWYYRWMLFSHFQRQDWQQRFQSMQAATQEMTLVNADCICGLCDTIGPNVKQTPETFSRIRQALNLNKLPIALTKPELNERVGLCGKCERKIKLLEEAASIRETLKESLFSNLQHLSKPDDYSYKNVFINGESPPPDCLSHPYAYRLQKTNEVTPDQHSIKRKISNMMNWTYNGGGGESAKRKQMGLNGQANSTDLPNSSDEENALMINESSSVSPLSSIGSYTPPPASSPLTYNLHHQPTSDTATQQVLSELTFGRNRRKQARPAKAAGNVVTAVPHQSSFEFSPFTSLRPPTSGRSYNTVTESANSMLPSPSGDARGSPAPQSRQSTPIPPAHPRREGVTPPAHSQQPQTTSTVFDIKPGRFSLAQQQQQQLLLQAVPNYSASLLKSQSSTLSPLSSSLVPRNPISSPGPVSVPSTFPFTYASLYQSNINILGSQPLIQSQAANAGPNSSVNASALILQSLYQAAASKPHLMAAAAANNPMMFAGSLRGVANDPLQFTKSAPTSAAGSTAASGTVKSDGTSLLMSAKKEPNVPLFGYGTPLMSKPGGAAKAGLSAESHTLVKTEKRRYCKVCTSSMRKANNGRPPQSRFLCMICNMPMCRSCIEEHRYRVMMKGNDVKSDIKPTASAKLLQAVKMKDSAVGGNVGRNSKAAQGLSSSFSLSTTTSSCTPPSHSSLIYGSLASVLPNLSPHVSSPAATQFAQQNNIYSTLPALPTLTAAVTTPLDMRVSAYKPIAPAPLKNSARLSDMLNMCGTSLPASNIKQELMVAPEDAAAVLSDEEEEGYDEKPLVISECETVTPATSEGAEHHAMEEDQTDITPEVASKTVAMLMAMDDEVATGGSTQHDQMFQSSIADAEISPDDKSSNDYIPVNTSAMPIGGHMNISPASSYSSADKENQKDIL